MLFSPLLVLICRIFVKFARGDREASWVWLLLGCTYPQIPLITSVLGFMGLMQPPSLQYPGRTLYDGLYLLCKVRAFENCCFGCFCCEFLETQYFDVSVLPSSSSCPTNLSRSHESCCLLFLLVNYTNTSYKIFMPFFFIVSV